MKSTFGDLSNGSKNKVLNLFDFKTAGFSGPTVPNNSFGFWADLHLDGH